jgi:hypothetical protein
MSILTKHLLFSIASLGLGSAMVMGQPATPAGLPSAAVNATPPPAPGIAGGKIKFSIPVYDFGRAKSGDQVRYTYTFTNTDPNEDLEIRGVQPQCGCTTAGEFSKKVGPGKSGTIAIQFNSSNYNGPVLKMITVSTSDRSQPSVMLQLKGTIWRPIEVNPLYAIITVSPDSGGGSSTVSVINNMPEPVSVFSPECNNHVFSATLSTNEPGKKYSLTVSTIGQLQAGNNSGQVTLKTDSTNAPVVNVIVMANVQPAVVVSPPSISLISSPLASAITNTITIQNNSTNKMVLSEPSSSTPGIGVDIKELQPGRVFLARISFPQGFELPQGAPANVTIKSSNPQNPLIKVPVVQMPRPMMPTRMVPPPPHATSAAGALPAIPVRAALPPAPATQ